MVPAHVGQVSPVRGGGGGGVEVGAGGEFADGSGILGPAAGEGDRDQGAVDTVVGVVLLYAQEVFAVGAQGGVGVPQRVGAVGFGGEGDGIFEVAFDQVEALVGAVGEDHAHARDGFVVASGHGKVGASTVFVHACAHTPGWRQELGDGAVGVAAQEGGTSPFVGTALLPPDLVSRDCGKRRPAHSSCDVAGADGRRPGAVGLGKFRHIPLRMGRDLFSMPCRP